MTRNRILGTALAVALAVGALLPWLRHPRDDAGDRQDAAPRATVTTAVARAQTLTDLVTAYGVVQADPAASITLAAPKALIVARLMVQPGQVVQAGQGLLEIANAPASTLAYAQAGNAAAFAQTDLARVQRLYDAHLAAADQLAAAMRAVADAQAGLVSQQAQSTGKSHELLTARRPAIVTTVSVAPGDHVAQDAPLLVLAGRNALIVKLGLEPMTRNVGSGAAVTIRPVGGGESVASHIAVVGAVADPATRTVSAVAPLAGLALPIGATVRADVQVGAHQGLLVPRASVVFDETGAHLFIVANGKARRLFVTAGADFGDQIEVRGDIKAGDPVAVQGAYELQDGVAVKVTRP